MKTITICDKEYQIECNALTYVKYKQIFKIGIFPDIQAIQTFVIMQSINKEKIEKEYPNIDDTELENKLGQLMLPVIDDFISAITRIAWILIYSANNNFKEYEEWLKSIDKFSINDTWIIEVTKFVVDCFC